MDGESRRRGSVLLKGVRGFFPEIFEKSIDKHEIDAILNAPSFSSGLLRGCSDGRALSRRIPRKNPVVTIPIQGNPVKHGRELLCACRMEGNGARSLCALFGGVL